tara:strand:+ start:6062 stop:6589 length:528 start_codon:yes stop_codon:yes gene_type:complete
MCSYIKNLFLIFTIIVFLASCGGLKRGGVDQPVNAKDRVKKNIEEGRGLRIATSLTNNSVGGGNFVFASSNPLWRATLEKLDFMPISNVDYAGGIIITDWYGDLDSNEEIKVAVRFLSNEIRSDALNVTIYKKQCIDVNTCQTSKIKNNTGDEIKTSILKRAAVLSKEAKEKNKE